ncbi:MAG: anti-anti-sigma factor [Flavobacteriales bacterium]|nr:anti-anti-sigma factor [Flavobacteriales bacterium]|tara:strand:+ start:946 stop:1341 length:396 start_codon:yes stop_codon:yes gene_type:complete
MSNPAYEIEKKDKYTLVRLLEEKFTARIAPDLKTELVLMNSQGIKNIIIDLEKSSYCDSSGLSVILVANRICKENDGCLVICNLQTAVSKLIEISQLSNVLNITPTYEEAVDFLFMDELEKGLGDIDENLN